MKKYLIMLCGLIILIGVILFVIIKSPDDSQLSEQITADSSAETKVSPSQNDELKVIDDGTKIVPPECYITYNIDVHNMYKQEIQNKNDHKKSIVEPSPVSNSCKDYHAVYKIEDGIYESAYIDGGLTGTFSLLNDDDEVNLRVNNKSYKLDKETPSIELQISYGDDIEVESKNKDGILYDSHTVMMRSDSGEMASNASNMTEGMYETHS